MSKKTNNILWGISLIVLAIGTLINSFRYIFDLNMPDKWTVVIGVVDLVMIFVLVYTSVKKVKKDE